MRIAGETYCYENVTEIQKAQDDLNLDETAKKAVVFPMYLCTNCSTSCE